MQASGKRALDAVRARARDALGIRRIHERLDQLEVRFDQLEVRLQESTEDTWQRSRLRWRAVSPDAGLTWGKELSGDAFVARLADYDAFTPEAAILEIGPGYGRLLAACLAAEAPFREYLGVDLSATNVTRLRERFDDPRIEFVNADVEQMTLDRSYDVLMSSLTFKHLYPSFERALANCAGHMRAGGLLFFDLIEGSRRMFETDGATYVRCYTRPEVQETVERVGLELAGFSEVEHDEQHRRLLTVARKPA